MTVINTNVSSLLAQNALQQSNNKLQTALTRLSTGLRINSGADDPAGLIDADTLGAQITAENQSISNAQQGNDILSTADAALAQVSNQLNSIRGLVQAAASKGSVSSSEIAADQQQVDAALQSIQTIGQTTQFGGQNLLNGSLAFNVNNTGGSSGPFDSTSDITISSFNPALHTATPGDDVAVNVTHAATQKTIAIAGTSSTSGVGLNNLTTSSTHAVTTIVANDFNNDGNSLNALNAGTGATRATRVLEINGTNGLANATGPSTANTDLTGASGALSFKITGQSGTSATINVSSGDEAALVAGDNSGGAVDTAAGHIVTSINAQSYQTGVVASYTSGGDITLTSTEYGTGGSIAVGSAANDGGSLAAALNAQTNGVNPTVPQATTFTITGGTTTNQRTATFTIPDNTTAINDPSTLVTLINGKTSLTGVTASLTPATSSAPQKLVLTSASVGANAVADLTIASGGGNNSGDVSLLADTNTAVKTLTAGVTSATQNTTTLNLIGDNGSSVITVNNDAVINDSNALANAINAVTGTTGITAGVASGQTGGADVTLTSKNYGSAAVVTLNAIAGAAGDVTDFNSASTQTSTAGTDAAGTVTTADGTAAFQANGNNITYSDSNIALSAIADPTLGTGVARFDVTGGALFQIGTDVNYQNQVNINLQGIDLATLGLNSSTDPTNALNSLKTGGANQLSSDDLTNAASIVNQAINQVATLQGNLGSLQTYVFQSSINSLQTGVEEITSAQSDIQDANFASETASLTQAQILVQAGTSVLSIANSRPQSVLSLLPH